MKYHRYMAIVIVAFFFLCLINATALAGWQFEIIDPGGPFTSFASLAFDASGHPAIAANGSRFARFNGTSWDITTFDPSGGAVGRVGSFHNSLAFDALGNPAVAYTLLNIDQLPIIRTEVRYAHFNGTTWDVTTIDIIDVSPVFSRTDSSLAFDATGNPAIAYSGSISLKYAQFNGTTWDITDVNPGEGERGGSSSLVFDGAGNPAIAYEGFGPSLKFAHFNGTTWDITTIDPIGSNPSLAFDATGNPAIAYGSVNSFKFARFNGTSWDITLVDARDIELSPSLAFDVTGNPTIAYGTSISLKFARFNGATWEITTVDAEGISGTGARTVVGDFLAFDPLGNPAITYNSDLKFARFVPNTPTTVSGVVTGPGVQPATSGVMRSFTSQSIAEKTVILRRIRPRPRVRMETVTDENGFYSFTNLEDGRYKIRVRECSGRNARTKVVITGGGMVSDKNFQCK